MTSSLVGSEMCIRDRHFTSAPKSRGRRQTRGSAAAGTATGTKLHRRSPVSYTHLTLPTICSV
eukprot:7630041-Prorocentrum_lima.AAC.1